MKTSDFHFDLPAAQIAQQPTARRRDARLLMLDGRDGEPHDGVVPDVLDQLRVGDVLVLNDIRVVPARLRGHKATGGRIEVLVERLRDERVAVAHVRASKSPGPDSRLVLDGGAEVRVIGRESSLFVLEMIGAQAEFGWSDWMEKHGEVPLPPYIDRPAEPADAERYQTVYARQPGAVAAPTAGLHLDDAMLAEIRTRGVEIATLFLLAPSSIHKKAGAKPAYFVTGEPE